MELQKIKDILTELASNGVFYDAGEGNETCNASGVDKGVCADLTERLSQLGFSCCAQNRIGASSFETLVNEELMVHVMDHPAIRTLRVTYGPKAYLPDVTTPIYERKATPTITQMHMQMVDNSITCDSISGRITANHGAPGMSYLLQLADGRFVMIDGGNKDGVVTPAVLDERGDFVVGEKIKTEDAARLYDTMRSMLPEGGEMPVIAAWLITHAHGDHMTLATDFLKTYGDRVRVEMIAFNFLQLENPAFHPIMKQWASEFRQAAKACSPRLQEWILHTGQKLLLPDCVIEVLCTAEDYVSSGKPLGDGNNVSAAFRITIGKTVFIALGDAYPVNCAFMRDAYRGALQCDILQLSHHGFDGSGAAIGFYEAMDPKICLWACDEFRFRRDRRNVGNPQEGHIFHAHYWLRNTPWVRERAVGAREHYTASYQTVIDAQSGRKIN